MTRKRFKPDDPTPSWVKRLERSLDVGKHRRSRWRRPSWLLELSLILIVVALLLLFTLLIKSI